MTIDRNVTSYYEGKKKVCNFKQALYHFPNPILPGGFSLPFTFRLPQNIPGSFNFNGTKSKAKIEYKFHAKLESTANENYKGKTGIHIIQPKFTYTNEVKSNKDAHLSTWCCLNKGKCFIHVKHHQDVYTPNQIATFTTKLDNSQSKLDILSLSSRLYYSLRLKDKNNRTHYVTGTLLNSSLPIKVPAGDALMATREIDMHLDLPTVKQQLENMYTTKGNLIECIYNIEVGAQMDGCCMCCGEYPSINTLMMIVPENAQVFDTLTPPENWNPVLLERAHMEYKESDDISRENSNI